MSALLPTRPLAPTEHHDLAAARLYAAHRLMPYLATALFRLRPHAVDGLGTFAVDGRWRLYVDPEVMARWGVQATAGVLLHEVGHALRAHAEAATVIGPVLDRHAWNLCADAAINDDLVAAGVPLPADPVLPGHLHDGAGAPLPDGWTAGRYYDALPRADVVLDEPADRAPGTDGGDAAGVVVVAGRTGSSTAACGAVAGGAVAPVEPPPDDDGVGDADQRLTRHAVAAAIGRAGPRGDVPAGLARWARAELAPPTVPWQQELRAAVRRGVAAVAGALDPTYARPSRRRVPGVVLPGSRRPAPSITVVIDTSSSMDAQLLAEALAEVEGITRVACGSGQLVRVLSVDAAVHTSRSVTGARQVALRGGGGTDLRPGLDEAVAGRAPADVVVVLTDGFTPWPVQPPRAATRWVVGLVGTATAADRPPPPPAWARTVHVGGDR